MQSVDHKSTFISTSVLPNTITSLIFCLSETMFYLPILSFMSLLVESLGLERDWVNVFCPFQINLFNLFFISIFFLSRKKSQNTWFSKDLKQKRINIFYYRVHCPKETNHLLVSMASLSKCFLQMQALFWKAQRHFLMDNVRRNAVGRNRGFSSKD